MLLETKGVVHMALLFATYGQFHRILAILTMILLSNCYVLLVRPYRLWPITRCSLAALT